MKCIRTACAAGVTHAVLSLGADCVAGQSHSQSVQQPAKSEIKILDNPGGGEYAFGPMTSQSNKADALIYMLHQVHGRFGDKPQVGKLFQSRDGSSLATFFTLTAKNMGGSPVTGLLIITQRGNGAPQMGILYDDSRRFVNSEPAMLKAVSAAWQGAESPAGGGPSKSPRPLPKAARTSFIRPPEEIAARSLTCLRVGGSRPLPVVRFLSRGRTGRW
jgi:hypothetical protein